MKKKLFYLLIFLITGIILGRKIYLATNNYETKTPTSTYYFLQEGVYSNKKILDENIKYLNSKVVETIDDKYHVYLGITKDYDIALKLKQIYESEGYQIYIKEINLDNMEFSNNLEQFDLLIENAKNKNEILTIEEVVLANYEEIIQKN